MKVCAELPPSVVQRTIRSHLEERRPDHFAQVHGHKPTRIQDQDRCIPATKKREEMRLRIVGMSDTGMRVGQVSQAYRTACSILWR